MYDLQNLIVSSTGKHIWGYHFQKIREELHYITQDWPRVSAQFLNFQTTSLTGILNWERYGLFGPFHSLLGREGGANSKGGGRLFSFSNFSLRLILSLFQVNTISNRYWKLRHSRKMSCKSQGCCSDVVSQARLEVRSFSFFPLGRGGVLI